MPNIVEIDDFNSTELDIYARLTENQLVNRQEPSNAAFIAESPKVIERALEAGYIPISILTERKHIEGQARDVIAKCGDIPVFTADSDILENITGYKLTRGVLCAMKRRPLPAYEEILSASTRVTVLENVVNPTNIGAIFRSAAALGMDAVLLTPACCDPLYRRSVRVSMGTVFQIPWTYLGSEISDWPHPGIETLQSFGFKTVAMALKDNSLPIDSPVLTSSERLAIVLGTEGDGLCLNTISDCDYTVKIPMSHGVDSLNVAAAGAVAFWQLGHH